MAACLITIAGTGTLKLDYDLGSDHNIQYTTPGDIVYIDDTATNVTYTTLTGTATASSGCLTITALPINYYTITYDRLDNDTSTYNSKFDALLLDTTVIALTPNVSDKSVSFLDIIIAINTTLANNNIKIVAYSISSAGSSANYNNISFVFRILGTEIPSLRLKSNFSNYSYIKGTTSIALPDGYIEIPIPVSPPL